MTTDYLTFLNLDVELVDGDRVIQTKVDDIDLLPEGSQFAVSGEAPSDGYLYVVETDQNDEVAVLSPSDGQPDLERAGTMVQLPAADQRYFVAPLSGTLAVVLAPKPVDANQWADLLGGRDPHPQNTSGPDL